MILTLWQNWAVFQTEPPERHQLYEDPLTLFQSWDRVACILISVRSWNFKDGGSLKSKLFGQESTCHQGKIFKKNPMSNDGLSKSAKIVLT